MVDITVIGNAVIDVVAYPVTKELFEKGSVAADSIKVLYGGDALNESVILSRFGKRVELISKVGEDGAGKRIINHLSSLGVAAEKVKVDSDLETSVNIVLVDKYGERHFLTNPKGSQRRLCEDDINVSLERCGKIISFASMFVSPLLDIESMTRIFKKIKEKNYLLAVDLTRAKNGERLEDLKQLLPYIDFIFPNESEIRILTGNSDTYQNMKMLLDAGVGCAVIKCGSKGSLIGYKDNIYRIPAYQVNKCIDTTGAGDSFVAGFLWALSEGWTVLDSSCFATATASCSVEVIGATEGVCSLEKALSRYEEIKMAL